MKLKTRIVSLCILFTMMVTACGTTNETANETTDTQNIVQNINDTVSVEDGESNIVTSPSEMSETADETAVPTYTEEEMAWLNAMMPKVEDSLNVRVEPSVEADVAGLLSQDDRAEVLELGEEWSKIKSGNLEGYVKNEYCFFGLEALARAEEICSVVATTTTEGLRLREEMSIESKIVDCLEEGQELVVNTAAETVEGWVAVRYKERTGYVSTEFVVLERKVGTGETVAEIAARLEAEEAAKKEAEKAAKEAAKKKEEKKQEKKEDKKEDSGSGSTVTNVSDLDLMAAIIYCEAGGESYETQLAVGAVIVNRMHSSRFPNTLSGVIYQRGQFTPASSGKLERVIRQGRANSSCYSAAAEALNGVDNTDGCLFFNDYNGSREGIRFGGMVFWW